MAFEQKPNSGALFKNDKKTTDKHPDYRGDLNIEGKPYWLSAWVRDGKHGKYLSISVQPKDDVSKDMRRPVEDMRGGAKSMDDEIPFAPEWR